MAPRWNNEPKTTTLSPCVCRRGSGYGNLPPVGPRLPGRHRPHPRQVRLDMAAAPDGMVLFFPSPRAAYQSVTTRRPTGRNRCRLCVAYCRFGRPKIQNTHHPGQPQTAPLMLLTAAYTQVSSLCRPHSTRLHQLLIRNGTIPLNHFEDGIESAIRIRFRVIVMRVLLPGSIDDQAIVVDTRTQAEL